MTAIQDTIVAPGMPVIDGVTFRQFRGEPDFEPMTKLHNVVHQAYGIEEVLSVEETAHGYAHPQESWDLSRDMLMAEADGQLIGFAGLESTLRLDGDRVFSQEVVVHPVWQARLEPALLQLTEQRAREIAIERPMNAPNFMQLWRPEENKASVALLLVSGYVAARHYFVMRRDLTTALPNAPLPDGIEVRTFEPAEANYRAVYAGNREAFRDHWGSRPWTEDDYQRWRSHPTHDTALWQIAWVSTDGTDEVVGVAINGIFAADNATYGFKRGWVENLSVRRQWRRRGLAKALLARTFVALRERGMTEAMLGVDAANPTGALHLYESVGFEVYKRNAVYRKKFSVLSAESRIVTRHS
jgi:mycothiol synthase